MPFGTLGGIVRVLQTVASRAGVKVCLGLLEWRWYTADRVGERRIPCSLRQLRAAMLSGAGKSMVEITRRGAYGCR